MPEPEDTLDRKIYKASTNYGKKDSNITAIGSSGQVWKEGEQQLVKDEKKTKLQVLTNVVTKLVKDSVKKTAGYMNGDDLAEKRAARLKDVDPNDFTEEDAWGDVKRAKEGYQSDMYGFG